MNPTDSVSCDSEVSRRPNRGEVVCEMQVDAVKLGEINLKVKTDCGFSLAPVCRA